MRYTQTFPSVAAFAAHLDKAQKSQHWGREASLEGAGAGNPTKDFGEAQNLMTYGDPESAKLIKDTGGVDLANIGITNHTQVVKSVTGYKPNVGAYLQGNPKSMYRRHTEPVRQPVITIYYVNTIPWYVSPREAAITSAKLLTIIRTIERTGGVKINLYACWAGFRGAEKVGIAVKIKDSNQPFNIMRLAYPMMHPDFCRRQCWRYLETCGAKYDSCYYICANKEKAEDIFKGYKYDKLITFMDIHGASEERIKRMLQ